MVGRFGDGTVGGSGDEGEGGGRGEIAIIIPHRCHKQTAVLPAIFIGAVILRKSSTAKNALPRIIRIGSECYSVISGNTVVRRARVWQGPNPMVDPSIDILHHDRPLR